MKKKLSIILLTVIVITAVLSLTACSEENKYVRFAVYPTDDGMSLFVTGIARDQVKGEGIKDFDKYAELTDEQRCLFDKDGNVVYSNDEKTKYKTVDVSKYIEVSYYVLLSKEIDNLDETLSAFDRNRGGIDIAFVPVDKLDFITKDSGMSIVFVDSYEVSGEIKGVWVARNDWLQSAPNYSRKFIATLIKCLNYASANTTGSYTSSQTAIDNDGKSIYEFGDYANVNDYLAIFTKQCMRGTVKEDINKYSALFKKGDEKQQIEGEDLSFKLTQVSYTRYSVNQTLQMYKDFYKGQGEGYNKCLALYNDKLSKVTNAPDFESTFNFDLMISLLYSYNHIFNA